jgi:hypothetical protein
MKKIILSLGLVAAFANTLTFGAQPQSVLITGTSIDSEQLLDAHNASACEQEIITYLGWDDSILYLPNNPIMHTDNGLVMTIHTSNGSVSIYCAHKLNTVCVDIMLFDRTVNASDKKALASIVSTSFETSYVTIKTIVRS